MDPSRGPLFAILVVLLFGLLMFLRTLFPDASRRAETIVLGITTAVFFGLCTVLLRH